MLELIAPLVRNARVGLGDPRTCEWPDGCTAARPMTNNMLPISAAVAIALCGCVEPDDPALGEDLAEIENGLEDVSSPRANATVQLSDGMYCSGTLVSPTQVLTSAHCIAPKVLPNMPATISATTVINGEIVAATPEGYLHAIDATTSTFVRPSVGMSPSLPGVTAAGGYLNEIYVVRDHVLSRSTNGGGAWQPLGNATNAIGLALTSTHVYVIDGAALRRRPRLDANAMWEPLASAAQATALTADRHGRVFAAFASGDIKTWTADDGWQTVGQLSGVHELASDGDFLFALTGSSLYLRRAEKWEMEGWTSAGTATGVAAIAGTRTTLYRFHTDGSRAARPTFNQWERREPFPQVTAMATSGNDLFAITADRHLRVRDANNPQGAWIDLGEQPHGLSFRAMTVYGGQLYAVGITGLLRRPATRTIGDTWVGVSSDYRVLELYAITAANGGFFALSEDGHAYWRDAVDGYSRWYPVADYKDGQAIASYGGRLYFVTPGLPLLASAAAPLTATDLVIDSVPRFDPWNSTLAYPLKGVARVQLGNDKRTWTQIDACTFRHPGDADAAIIELSERVDVSLALPAPILYDEPGGAGFWDSQTFTTVGWGGMIDDDRKNKLVQRDGSSWSEIGTVPGSTHALGRNGNAWTAVTRSGDVYHRVGTGSWGTRLFNDAGANAAATTTNDLWVIRDREVQFFNVSARTFGSIVPVTNLLSGERLVAGTLLGSFVYASTSNGRTLRFNASAGWSDTGKQGISARSITSDATYLYVQTHAGNLYRSLPSDTTWSSLGSGDPATAIAAWSGVIYGSYPDMPRYRQRGSLYDWTWPYVSEGVPDPRRAKVQGAVTIRGGDSGGSLYWDSAGTRYLMGITQAETTNGGIFKPTFYGGGVVNGKPQQNLSAWLHHHIAEGSGIRYGCP